MNRQSIFLGAPVGVWVNSGKTLQISYREMVMNLYWVETEDHDEDWFVMANSENEAVVFFAHFEGYEEDFPTAKFVCQVDGKDLEKGWPDEEVLLNTGAEIEDHGGARVVRLNGSIYAEGLLESVMLDIDKAIEINK